MESFLDSIFDFIRVRQLNIAVAAVLSLGYFVYQYWGCTTKLHGADDDDGSPHSRRLSRSRSRSSARSRSRSSDHCHHRASDTKRRGRKCSRRCHNYS